MQHFGSEPPTHGGRNRQDAVKQATGIALDKRKIELDEPIKALGTYEVSVRLHPGVSASLKVQVVEG